MLILGGNTCNRYSEAELLRMEKVREMTKQPWAIITSIETPTDTTTPNITSVSPTVIPYTKGTEITILGTNLKEVVSVSFGDMYLATPAYVDDKMVVAKTPSNFIPMYDGIDRPIVVHTVHGKVSNTLHISLSKTAMVTPTSQDTFDPHGCNLTKGQSYCPSTDMCVNNTLDCVLTQTPVGSLTTDIVIPSQTHKFDAHQCNLTLEQFWCESAQKCYENGADCQPATPTTTPDPHGCSPDQDWCSATGNCIPKGSVCSVSVMDLDEHGCCTSCGDSWCEYSQTCVLSGGMCEPIGGEPGIITNTTPGGTPSGETGGTIVGVPMVFVGAAALIAVLLISK